MFTNAAEEQFTGALVFHEAKKLHNLKTNDKN